METSGRVGGTADCERVVRLLLVVRPLVSAAAGRLLSAARVGLLRSTGIRGLFAVGAGPATRPELDAERVAAGTPGL